MIMAMAQALLTMQEGCKLFPYRCPAGKLTIGVGHNLDDNGITHKEALYILKNDIKECEADLAKLLFPHQFYSFPEDIQLVLISMRFQLGRKGFRSFKKMIWAFKSEDYSEAIAQMKDSKWYGQVPNRANELIAMVQKNVKGEVG